MKKLSELWPKYFFSRAGRAFIAIHRKLHTALRRFAVQNFVSIATRPKLQGSKPKAA